ncbi:hypothetical protein HPG69_015018, partial [Diceros bicornis minor]
MGLQLDFCDSNTTDHFTCDSSLMLLLACTDTEFPELVALFLAVFTRMNNSEDPLCPATEKGLFHLFFPYDCGFHLLWELHFH